MLGFILFVGRLQDWQDKGHVGMLALCSESLSGLAHGMCMSLQWFTERRKGPAGGTLLFKAVARVAFCPPDRARTVQTAKRAFEC